MIIRTKIEIGAQSTLYHGIKSAPNTAQSIFFTWGGSYGTSTLCLPVMGSSTYWAWLFPSTRIK